jgi:hypothetical protein
MNMVASWRCTREAQLEEPVLVLRTTDGREMRFMLPAAAAEEMGAALMAQGRRTARVGPAH